MTSRSPREPFESDAPLLHRSPDAAPSPALSSSNASARFEFEAGRGNAGTKILMVEWSAPSSLSAGDGEGNAQEAPWEVSWEGKSTVVASAEPASASHVPSPASADGDGAAAADDADAQPQHRIYFLLPPTAPIPRLVQISRRGASPPETLQTNPLPAIFPAELGASARAAGRKGVLHTRWAKRRVAVLEGEIEREGRLNGEGIALEMAVRERVWIEENFGVGAGGGGLQVQTQTPPVSPGAGKGRMAERMRGLKVGTSAVELSGRPPANIDTNPLSPETSDVAIGAPAFSLFHSTTITPSSAHAPAAAPARVLAVSHPPPRHLLAKQAGSLDTRQMNSLDALAGADLRSEKVLVGMGKENGDAGKDREDDDEEDDDEELFAVTMGPRSPEMARSPFSLVSEDVVPWR